MWAGFFIALASAALIILEVTKPDTEANLLMHSHITLSYYEDGARIPMPELIGISDKLWNDHSLDDYGENGVSPLHTHKLDGVIHVESTVLRMYTLGEFLDIWGLDLEGKEISLCAQYGDVPAIVPCQPVDDYRNFVLANGDKLRLEVDD